MHVVAAYHCAGDLRHIPTADIPVEARCCFEHVLRPGDRAEHVCAAARSQGSQVIVGSQVIAQNMCAQQREQGSQVIVGHFMDECSHVAHRHARDSRHVPIGDRAIDGDRDFFVIHPANDCISQLAA